MPLTSVAAFLLRWLAGAIGLAAADAASDAEQYLRAGIREFHRGRQTFQVEPLQRAKKYLAHAVAAAPSPEGFFYLGGTLGLLSKPRTAARAYYASLELDPKNPSTHQNLAQVLEDTGNKSAALTHYRWWANYEPRNAHARKALATSLLWSGFIDEGASRCHEAIDLDTTEPSIAYDCAQMFVLLLRPNTSAPEPQTGHGTAEAPGEAIVGEGGGDLSDSSSQHYLRQIAPLFTGAQEAAFKAWRGIRLPCAAASCAATPGVVCPSGARALYGWESREGTVVEEVSAGGEVYGQQTPHTFGGPFTWAGQRYMERGVRVVSLQDVVVSGNEGIITRGCDVFVPYYNVQVPWHENLPSDVPPGESLPQLREALWLLVMYPANFFSFLVDELARLAVWLTTRRHRVPLLVPADRGNLKPFMHDWFTLFGGFEIITYDIRPHFMGAATVAAPRFLVQELHIVDWTDPPGSSRRGDVFLLPPRWALLKLRSLAVGLSSGAWSPALASHSEGSAEAEDAANEHHREKPVLLWIERAVATTRRTGNKEALMQALRLTLDALPGPSWEIRAFSDDPTPAAHKVVEMFQSASIVAGIHGSGQANLIFCRPGTGIIDINLPEPHSQYTSHNSYALGLRYRLVMLRGTALHQALNITVPIDDVIEALRSLL